MCPAFGKRGGTNLTLLLLSSPWLPFPALGERWHSPCLGHPSSCGRHLEKLHPVVFLGKTLGN